MSMLNKPTIRVIINVTGLPNTYKTTHTDATVDYSRQQVHAAAAFYTGIPWEWTGESVVKHIWQKPMQARKHGDVFKHLAQPMHPRGFQTYAMASQVRGLDEVRWARFCFLKLFGKRVFIILFLFFYFFIYWLLFSFLFRGVVFGVWAPFLFRGLVLNQFSIRGPVFDQRIGIRYLLECCKDLRNKFTPEVIFEMGTTSTPMKGLGNCRWH